MFALLLNDQLQYFLIPHNFSLGITQKGQKMAILEYLQYLQHPNFSIFDGTKHPKNIWFLSKN